MADKSNECIYHYQLPLGATNCRYIQVQGQYKEVYRVLYKYWEGYTGLGNYLEGFTVVWQAWLNMFHNDRNPAV